MPKNTSLINGKTATGYYNGVAADTPLVVQGWIDGAAAVEGVVEVYGSNDPRALTNPSLAAGSLLATLTFTGTGGGTDPPETYSFYVEQPYSFYFCSVTAISGTNAAISVVAGSK